MLGDENGYVPAVMTKEVNPGDHTKCVVSSDYFDQDELYINWQWNHNPINDKWSLKERPGYLRLKTNRIVDNLFLAPNTLQCILTAVCNCLQCVIVCSA